MKFKQHCFIRKNTPALCRMLEDLGYRHNDLDENDRKWLAANYDMYISVDKGFDRLNPNDIDCGTNEDMFLALAALRTDCDYMQWFICTQEYLSYHNLEPVKVGTWQLNKRHWKLNCGLKTLWRKATAEEIVEHFKRNK